MPVRNPITRTDMYFDLPHPFVAADDYPARSKIRALVGVPFAWRNDIDDLTVGRTKVMLIKVTTLPYILQQLFIHDRNFMKVSIALMPLKVKKNF
jgi:hypothetical protein